MTKGMEKAPATIQMEANIQVIGSMMKKRVKVFSFGRMVIDTRSRIHKSLSFICFDVQLTDKIS
jgi:hypothetical protein